MNINLRVDFVFTAAIYRDHVFIQFGFMGRELYLMLFNFTFGTMPDPCDFGSNKIVSFALPHFGKVGTVHKFAIFYKKRKEMS